jgi:hypothetical protein
VYAVMVLMEVPRKTAARQPELIPFRSSGTPQAQYCHDRQVPTC